MGALSTVGVKRVHIPMVALEDYSTLSMRKTVSYEYDGVGNVLIESGTKEGKTK